MEIFCSECLRTFYAEVEFRNHLCNKSAMVGECTKLESTDIKQQKHYTQHKIQPVIFIGENKLDFLAGNVIKYVSRYNLKNGVQDPEKARHYLDMLIQREKGEAIAP